MPKRTVIVLISFISLIVIIALGAFAVNRVRVRLINNLIDQYYTQEQALAEETANLLKAEIVSLQDKLQIITQLPAINTPQDSNSCNQTLQLLTDKMKVKANNLGRVNVSGEFICSLNPALIGAKAATFGKYIEDIFNDPLHNPVMSRATRVPNVEGFIFAVHVPVLDAQGHFNGTLGGAIYFNDLQKNYLENVTFSNQGYAAIYDDNADVLYHPRKELIGKNLFGDEVQDLLGRDENVNAKFREAVNEGIIGRARYKLQGSDRVAVLYPIEIFPGRRWIVIVVTPTQEIENSLISSGTTRDFVGLTILLTLLLTVTPAIILYYINRSIFRPLAKVTYSINKITSGDFDQKVDYLSLSAKDEINKLVLAFNKMADQLKDLYMNLNKKVAEKTEQVRVEKESLEKKVAERTTELNKAKATLEEEVNKQTAELRTSLDEVQKINIVMVDREKRIIELKDKVKELEEELAKAKSDAN